MKFVRHLLVAQKLPSFPGTEHALRDPRWQAILVCTMPPGLLAYVLWERFIGPYYAATGGLIGGVIGLGYLFRQVSIVISEDEPEGGSNG